MSQLPQTACFAGIDVSKIHLDVHLRPLDRTFQVGNDAEGIQTLLAQLRACPVDLVVLEATGGYEREVYAQLRLHLSLSMVGIARLRVKK